METTNKITVARSDIAKADVLFSHLTSDLCCDILYTQFVKRSVIVWYIKTCIYKFQQARVIKLMDNMVDNKVIHIHTMATRNVLN